MKKTNVYKKAIAALHEGTHGRFEHDEEKAIELFDKLLDAGEQTHCDTVRNLCIAAGYSEHAAREIAAIYDVLSLYKQYKKSGAMHWDIDQLLGQ